MIIVVDILLNSLNEEEERGGEKREREREEREGGRRERILSTNCFYV